MTKDFKERLYIFVLQVIKLIRKLPHELVNEVISKQLMRSSTSILANYIEAKSASSKKDYINFFTHALKSANESKVWLALLRDTCQNNQENIRYLLKELGEISNIIAASIITLKKNVKE